MPLAKFHPDLKFQGLPPHPPEWMGTVVMLGTHPRMCMKCPKALLFSVVWSSCSMDPGPAGLVKVQDQQLLGHCLQVASGRFLAVPLCQVPSDLGRNCSLDRIDIREVLPTVSGILACAELLCAPFQVLLPSVVFSRKEF